MSVTGIPTNAMFLIFISFDYDVPAKSQIPGSKSQAKSQTNKVRKPRTHEPPVFEIMDEKISVSSRASFSKASREFADSSVDPPSVKRKKSRLSFASFLQIFTRIKKSFLLSASSASIQFAATDPDARTSWRTSSALLIFRGKIF